MWHFSFHGSLSFDPWGGKGGKGGKGRGKNLKNRSTVTRDAWIERLLPMFKLFIDARKHFIVFWKPMDAPRINNVPRTGGSMETSEFLNCIWSCLVSLEKFLILKYAL